MIHEAAVLKLLPSEINAEIASQGNLTIETQRETLFKITRRSALSLKSFPLNRVASEQTTKTKLIFTLKIKAEQLLIYLSKHFGLITLAVLTTFIPHQMTSKAPASGFF